MIDCVCVAMMVRPKCWLSAEMVGYSGAGMYGRINEGLCKTFLCAKLEKSGAVRLLLWQLQVWSDGKNNRPATKTNLAIRIRC